MTPITPMLDTPTGRLAELVHLLSDRPLAEAVSAVADTAAQATTDDDPWWVVAGALVKLRRNEAAEGLVYDFRVPA